MNVKYKIYGTFSIKIHAFAFYISKHKMTAEGVKKKTFDIFVTEKILYIVIR